MRKFSAHYIFDGYQYHKLAVLVLDDHNAVVALEEAQKPYVEQSGVEFYNGVICYDKQNKSDIVLLENFDFFNFQKNKNTKETILVYK